MWPIGNIGCVNTDKAYFYIVRRSIFTHGNVVDVIQAPRF